MVCLKEAVWVPKMTGKIFSVIDWEVRRLGLAGAVAEC